MAAPLPLLEQLDGRYGRLEGRVFTPGLPPFVDPVRFVGWRRVEAPVPLWHVISVGLSEFAEKETDDVARSGYGIELSLRFKVVGDEKRPAEWAESLLQSLGLMVFWSDQLPPTTRWLRFDRQHDFGGSLGRVRAFAPRMGFDEPSRPLRFLAGQPGPLRKMYEGLRAPRHEGDAVPSGGLRPWSGLPQLFSAAHFYPDPEIPTFQTPTGRVDVLTLLVANAREDQPLTDLHADRTAKAVGDWVISSKTAPDFSGEP